MNNQGSDPKQIIMGVLEMINYEGDRQKYADDLIASYLTKSLKNLVVSLPQQRQEELNVLLASEKDPNKVLTTLRNEFTEEEYLAEVKKTTETMFSELIKDLEPTLSDENKAKLKDYITKFSTSPNPA